jgi:antitoxin component HigA of HigAB toxin-antitoxin module
MKQLTNEKEYRAVTKRIDELLEVVTDENYYSAPEAVELDILSDLVEEYENRNYPIITRCSISCTFIDQTSRKSKVSSVK